MPEKGGGAIVDCQAADLACDGADARFELTHGVRRRLDALTAIVVIGFGLRRQPEIRLRQLAQATVELLTADRAAGAFRQFMTTDFQRGDIETHDAFQKAGVGAMREHLFQFQPKQAADNIP